MLNMILEMNPIGQIIIVLILLVLFMTFFAIFKIKTRYLSLVYDLDDLNNRKSKIFKYELNNAISDEFKSAMDLRISEVNTPAIIDKNLQFYLKKILLAERFVVRASGLMIILGLVGTFFGLTLSISELVNLLSNTNEAIIGDANMITSGLLSSISGMSVAFVTSLFGISASILVNLMTIIFGVSETREHYIAVAEEYLDNVLGLKTTDMTVIDEYGRTPLEASFEELGNRLSSSIQTVSESISYRMTVASNSMKETAELVDKSMAGFNESINMFSENTRDFSEFNHHLKSNIERMSLTFEDFTESLKEREKKS